MGINFEQGIGFAEYTGSFPMPESRTGVIKIIDENNYARLLVLDFSDGKFYDISMRDGPTGSGIERIFKDKADVSGGGGYDITPEVEFKEDTGEYEKFVISNLSNRIYLRPDKETNRFVSGYDLSGFPNSIQFDATIFVDGHPNIETAESKDITRTGELLFDRDVEGTRIRTKITANKSGFRIVGRQQDYIAKDINYKPDERVTTEGTNQDQLSAPILWFTRGETPTKDRITGTELTGSISNVTGPDGFGNSGFRISSAITTPSISSVAAKTMFYWVSGTSGNIAVTIGGTPITFTGYNNLNSWYLNYASGITASGNIVITPTGTRDIFDIIMYSGNKSSYLEYYFEDIIYNHAYNVCPIN